jgi:hypothetical protein
VLHDPGLPLPALPALHSSGRVRGFDAVLCCDLVPCDISNTGARLASSRSRAKHPGLHTPLRPSNPASRSAPKPLLQCGLFRKLNNFGQDCTWGLPVLQYVGADVSSDFLAAAMTGHASIQVPTKRSVREVHAIRRGVRCPERHGGCRASRVPGSRITDSYEVLRTYCVHGLASSWK